MGNVLVLTGVTGPKSGAAFIDHLAKNIDIVDAMFPGGITIICRESSQTDKIIKVLPDAVIKRGNIRNSDFLTEVLAACDTLVHVAGIQFSKDIVDAAIIANVRRLILVHTTGVFSKYKKAAAEYRDIDNYVEKRCDDNGIVLTILRPTMIYGNMNDNNIIQFIKMVDMFPVIPILRGGKYKLQPVHYEDLGNAYFCCLMNETTTGGKNYTLSGGEVIELKRMLAVIGMSLNKNVKFINCPYWLAYMIARGLFLCTFGKIDYREKVQRLCENRSYDHDDATRDFGYKPRSFQVGIINEVKEYLLNKVS